MGFAALELASGLGASVLASSSLVDSLLMGQPYARRRRPYRFSMRPSS